MANANISIGNYTVVRELASGSFGHVYLAQHKLLTNRIVAIKLLRATHLDSPEEREGFLQEAHFLAGLRHPHILSFVDFGIHEGFPYLVAEYAPNGTLKERLRSQSPHLLPMEESLAILSQVGEALSYAHQQNIVHRDLKPGNILFNARGEALVADFGLATTLDTASIKQVNNEGTPRYMAPEQFQGIASRESDQYALGVIAYELFTGHQPFTAPDFFTMGYKKITEDPIPPTHYNPFLPASIEQAILKAIAKNRGDRHANVQAFIIALHTPGVSQASQPSVSQINLPVFPVSGIPTLSGGQVMPNQLSPFIESVIQTQAPTLPEFVPSSNMGMAQTFPLIPDVPTEAPDRSSSGGRSQGSQGSQAPPESSFNDEDTDKKGSPRSQQILADQEFVNTVPFSTGASAMPPEEHVPTLILRPNEATVPGNEQVPTLIMHEGEPTRPIPPADKSAMGAINRPLQRTEGSAMGAINQATMKNADTILAPPLIPGGIGNTRRKERRRKFLFIAAAFVLALLLASGGVLYAMNIFGKPTGSPSQTHSPTNPGTSNATNTSSTSNAAGTSIATVTITPASKDLKLTYTIFEVTGTPDASQNQVGGARQLSFSTQAGSQTFNATGQGTTGGTHASGTLELDNPNSYSFPLSAGTSFTGADGVTVYTSSGVTVPANNSAYVSAYAGPIGTSGNIGAYDIDANYPVPGHSPDQFRVQNTQAFSGGTNPQTYTFVRQSDIDSATNALYAALMPTAQQGVQSQIASNEQLIGTIQCSLSNTSANHSAGDAASSVTVYGSVTCSGEVYNPQMAQPLAVNLFKHDLTSQLGANYSVVGDVLTTVSQPKLLGNGTVSVQVQAEGVGVFQFSNAQQQQLAKLIAGKSKNDAQALLLKQAGVHDASINVSGSSNAILPTDTRNIKIVVAKVSGLKARS